MSHISRLTHTAAVFVTVAFSLTGVHLSSTTLAAQSAPPLAAPTGTIINVSTEAALQAAVAALASNTTIVLAPGIYTLTSTLQIRGPLVDVGLRGATANADDVVLVGRGMTNADHGTVPDGISVSGRVQRITIANLTIKDVSNHPILLNSGMRAPHLYNLHLLDAGRQFVKAGSDDGGVHDGRIEHSTIEYTTASALASLSGIEVLAGRGWALRKNVFRNLKAPAGLLAGPAILMWHGSRDTVAEGNTFINCQREIAYGAEERNGSDHAGGIIRNNFIYRESSVSGDVAIQLADSPGTAIVHNTILANGTATSPIEYRFPTTTGIDIRNNLLDGPIMGRDGASGTVESNYTRATADMFANAATGDLHLVASAGAVIDAAQPLPGAETDWDGQSRPQGRAADYGADELTATSEASTAATALTGGGSGTSDASLLQATDATALASTTGLPAPWKETGVGNPPLPGFVAYASGMFAVQAGGADIGGSSDQFWFVYQPLDGDGEVVARVDSLNNTHALAKAGVMIREDLTARSKHAFAMVTAAQGLAFQWRTATGGSAAQSAGGSGTAPRWLKLKRQGSTFTAFSSTNGSTWTPMGSASVSMNRVVHVGLAVTSRSVRVNTNAVFTGVNVTRDSGGENKPPSVSITAPAPGATYTAPASITVAAKAADADGSVTKVDFYAGSKLIGSDSSSPFSVSWSNVPGGRYEISAVAHDNGGAWTPSSPVQITVSGNQPPSVTLTSPAPNATFAAPATITMTASATDSDGTVSKVEFYAGSTRIGSDSSNPYSVTWTNAPAGSYTLSAKAFDNTGASMISAGVNVNIGGANQAPSVSLTAPAAGTNYAAPATVTISASASDPDGTVARVDFFAGSTLVGSDSSSPFSITWSSVPSGTYSLTARARDDDGATRTSSAVSISVSQPGAALPQSVLFNASADHASVTYYTVEVFKAGTNPAGSSPFRSQNAGKPTPVNGEITVEIGSMIQALPAGSYFLTISATSSGGTSRSAPSETFLR